MYDDDEPRLVGASDEKGHSALLTTRVPPDWLRQIDITIKATQFPYKNRGDFIRDAVSRHLQFAEKYSGCSGSILGKIKAMTDLIEEDRHQQGFESVLTNLRERVDYYHRKGADKEAVRCVLQVLQYVDEMRDGHWKDTFRKTIRQEYQGLLTNSQKVALIPNEDEDGDNG